ncbi:MAG: D-2-hydroxyacid dehydrogenase [Acidobacteria bacterium]|nr:D-2-hydroxyacid dehydrogenase [Acidobacteriota bacterium]MBV9625770.1 D-2-hydroxyacid dehydrogenase [Acidobacteriota bacterium]
MTGLSKESVKKLLVVTYHRLDLWIAPEWFGDRIRANFPQLEVVRLTGYDGLEKELPDADIAFTLSLRPEQFRQARRLRWIHSPAAAVHQLMFPELVDSDVIVTNARDVHGPVVAEHVLGLILALAKKIPEAVRYQQKHVWAQEILWAEAPGPREIAGATLGLVGLGSIGTNVAKRAFAMGMQVVAVREHPGREKPEYVEQVLPSSQLDAMLARSDYVVLSPPLTPRTNRLIGVEQLSKMKAWACLINVGRGPLIDDAALIDALSKRRIAAAALDVFESEPLPANSPLWELNNLLITPHIAGMTERLWERHYSLFSENLRRFLNGQPMLAVIDKHQGY